MHNIYMEQFTSIVWCLVPENILDGSPGKGNRTTHIVYGKLSWNITVMKICMLRYKIIIFYY